MTTFKRICLKTETFIDGNKTVTLERGKEYITSDVHDDGQVTIFTRYWFRVPVAMFAGEEKFT